VVEAGLQNLAASDRCDPGCTPPASAPEAAVPGAAAAKGGVPHCHDVLLLRVRAQLLLAVADANGALAVLGSARRRLANARRALDLQASGAAGGSGSSSGDAAAALLQEQEAQVCAGMT
jgi:hypothetical protein